MIHHKSGWKSLLVSTAKALLTNLIVFFLLLGVSFDLMAKEQEHNKVTNLKTISIRIFVDQNTCNTLYFMKFCGEDALTSLEI